MSQSPLTDHQYAIRKSVDMIVRDASKKWDTLYGNSDIPPIDKEGFIASAFVNYIELLSPSDVTVKSAATRLEKAVENAGKTPGETPGELNVSGRVINTNIVGSVSKFKLTSNGKETKMFVRADEGGLSSYWITVHGVTVEQAQCETSGEAISRLNYWHNTAPDRPERPQKKSTAKSGLKGYLGGLKWLG